MIFRWLLLKKPSLKYVLSLLFIDNYLFQANVNEYTRGVVS